ncbi:MAG: PGF-CTERM sorting domain-containing protein [Euryarchaeota archaeon]|nr:PGF-CTERM sorting domain-containing protein [Euryarchaeota archaeon]
MPSLSGCRLGGRSPGLHTAGRAQRTLLLFLLLLLLCATSLAAGQTESVRVVRCAGDGSVLNETTVTYQRMEANLPVYGDGTTHYYHQGPVFEGDKWDQNETVNFKDKGAVKGTNVRDLCDLVGGASPGDDVMIHAVDGYHVEFCYENIYEPPQRQGPIVLCWYDSETGYPPDYFAGLRIVFFADDNVFGNWDMHECLPLKSQHFFGDLKPSTGGLSVRWVDEIRIYAGGYTGEQGGPAKSMPTQTPKSSPAPGFGAVSATIGLLSVAFILRWRGLGR